MYDLWSENTVKSRKKGGKTCKNICAREIMFDPLPGQSINPNSLDHEKLVNTVIEALSSKENSLIAYNSRAFGLSKRNPDHSIVSHAANIEAESHELKVANSKSCLEEEVVQNREKNSQPIFQTKSQHAMCIDKDVVEHVKHAKSMSEQRMLRNGEKNKKKTVIPEVTENAPIQMRNLDVSEFNSIEMVHKRMKCAGMVSKRRQLANKRGHRAIRFRWSWVPYHRNYVTNLKPRNI